MFVLVDRSLPQTMGPDAFEETLTNSQSKQNKQFEVGFRRVGTSSRRETIIFGEILALRNIK